MVISWKSLESGGILILFNSNLAAEWIRRAHHKFHRITLIIYSLLRHAESEENSGQRQSLRASCIVFRY